MSEGNDEVHGPNVDDVQQGDLPVVLQCSQCNVILGDSLSWVSTNDQLKSVTLHSVTTMVGKGKKLVTSTEGVDLGSTYLQLQCKSCQEVIGRIYRTTPRALDELRDLYSLSITKINCYQVGSMDQTSGPGDTMDMDNIKQLRASITKTQALVCTLNERVSNIETAMQMEEEEAEGAGGAVDDDNEEEGDKLNGTDMNRNQKHSPHDDASDDSAEFETEKKENSLTMSEQGDNRHGRRGGTRHSNHRASTKDYGKDLQMPSGKRGKPQLLDSARDNKRARFK